MFNDDIFSVLFASVFIVVFIVFLFVEFSDFSNTSYILSLSENKLSKLNSLIGEDFEIKRNELIEEVYLIDRETNLTIGAFPNSQIILSLPVIFEGHIARVYI